MEQKTAKVAGTWRMPAAGMHGHGPHVLIDGKPYTYPGAARSLRKKISEELSKKFEQAGSIPETEENTLKIWEANQRLAGLKANARILSMQARGRDSHLKEIRKAISGMVVLLEEIRQTEI